MVRPTLVAVLILTVVSAMIFYGIPRPFILGSIGVVLTFAGVVASIKISRWWLIPTATALSFFWLLYARLTIFC